MRICVSVLLACLSLSLSGCGRPLSHNEKTFIHQIYGESFATSRARLHNGALVGSVTFQRKPRPRLTCRERIFPPAEDEIVTTSPAAEHSTLDDPYLFEIETENRFLDYPYEQQASLVEEYVCCTTLDPDAPRTKRLEEMLSAAFPLGKLHIPQEVSLPWDEAETQRICR